MTRAQKGSTVLGVLFFLMGLALLLVHWWLERTWHTLPNVFGFSACILGALLIEPAAVGHAIRTLFTAIRGLWKGAGDKDPGGT